MQEEAASFTLMGGLRPFQKARVCSLGPRRLAQPSRLFFMSLTKARWMGRELLPANSYCETRWVYQRSLLASPSVLEVERSRQETTDWFCCKHACISEFTWVCFPRKWSSHLPVPLLPVLTTLYQCSETPWRSHFLKLAYSPLFWVTQMGAVNSFRLECNFLNLESLCISLLGLP